MNNMALVTGATGKVGRRLVIRLGDGGVDCRAASRDTEPPFDWTKSETWSDVLDGISSIYLIAPPAMSDPSALMIDFVTLALSKRGRRVVLQSAAPLPLGAPGLGQVHEWLRQHALDWAVLRPNWMMQNFSEGPFAATIRGENAIYSATAEGRVAFVSADDVAASAFAALTMPAALNSDLILTSDDPITYDRVAELISAACGREILHHRLTKEALADRYHSAGVPGPQSQRLAGMDQAIAAGAGDLTTDAVKVLTGTPPVSFPTFANASRDAWKLS